MARIRTIKPEFWCSEQVVECSPTARLLFIGIWTFSDDSGVHPASLARVKMEVFPGDMITPAQIAELVGELKSASLLIEYEVDAKVYWQVTGWHHQKIDKPTFKYPRRDGLAPESPRVIGDNSSSGLRAVDESSPPESNGEDKEKKKRKESTRGTRLPNDWVPSYEAKAWAMGHRADLDIEEQIGAFVDYWRSVAGAKGCKLDWDATWRNWIRQTHAPRGRTASSSIPASPMVML